MPQNELSAAVISRRNLRDQLLAAWPELSDDALALADTLAGIDDFEEQILATLRHAMEREAHGKALGELIEGMRSRKLRLEDGAKWLRAAVLNAMQEADLPRIRAADMTINVGRGKPKVIVTEPDKVPDDLCRITREPNKTEIGKALAEGRDVAGACLGNANPFLSVHRS